MQEKFLRQEGGPRWMRSIGWSRQLVAHALLLVLSLLAVMSLTSMPAGALTYYSQPPYPAGRLLYAQPTLRWKVWPSAGYRVESEAMSLNGRPVRARYAVADRAVVYTPDAPLHAGRYAV